jgi:hypothetical integral membrane protein (TIGR02206 family)
MVGLVSPAAYGVVVAVGVVSTAVLVVEARRHPGHWTVWAARAIGAVLLADAICFVFSLVTQGQFSVQDSLPLPLCDLGAIVAAAACFWRVPVLVELTYFWGLAGTLQAVVTPDLATPFPHLAFFEYTVGHVGIVVAALFLVIGLRITPRPKAVPRVLAITAAYTAFVGLVDALTGADYMFLRSPPASWSLLSVLGPWPWYVLSATGVAVVLLVLLDLPFWHTRPPVVRAWIARLHSSRSGRSPHSRSAGSPRSRRSLRLRWPS